jgi:hypothetical protein
MIIDPGISLDDFVIQNEDIFAVSDEAFNFAAREHGRPPWRPWNLSQSHGRMMRLLRDGTADMNNLYDNISRHIAGSKILGACN